MRTFLLKGGGGKRMGEWQDTPFAFDRMEEQSSTPKCLAEHQETSALHGLAPVQRSQQVCHELPVSELFLNADQMCRHRRLRPAPQKEQRGTAFSFQNPQPPGKWEAVLPFTSLEPARTGNLTWQTCGMLLSSAIDAVV